MESGDAKEWRLDASLLLFDARDLAEIARTPSPPNTCHSASTAHTYEPNPQTSETGIDMQRTLSHRTTDNGRLLLEEHTTVFRLTPQHERGAAELGVSAGQAVRLELLDDGGHRLDSMTYVVPPTDG